MKRLLLYLLLVFATPVFSQRDSGYTYARKTQDGTGKYYFGREIAQIMGPGGIEWLERPERQTEQKTDLATEKMQVAPNAVVADIGAGSGYYTFRMAAKVPKGKVYAVEVQDEMIRFLEKKKKETHAANVIVVKGDSVQIPLPESSLDLVIMVDVYHELLFPAEILRSLSKSLKPSGKILLIEFRGEDPAVPIKPLHKTTVKQLNRELYANGFVPDYRGEFLPIQHYLLYKKRK